MADSDRFIVCLEVVIRPCSAQDLPALEWFGLFAPHRALIRRIFQRHQRGQAVMLVAQVNQEASGQLWIDLQPAERTGEIWALRVLPCLQGHGIGERLVRAAEDLLRARGFCTASVSVDSINPAARRLFDRLGYRLTGTCEARHPPDAPGQYVWTQWLLAKDLKLAPRVPQELK